MPRNALRTPREAAPGKISVHVVIAHEVFLEFMTIYRSPEAIATSTKIDTDSIYLYTSYNKCLRGAPNPELQPSVGNNDHMIER